MLEKKPFVRYKEDKDKFVIIPLRLNEYDQRILASSKENLKQPKDATAIKQLMYIGAKYIHDEKMSVYIEIILENKRKNKRLGIIDFD